MSSAILAHQASFDNPVSALAAASAKVLIVSEYTEFRSGLNARLGCSGRQIQEARSSRQRTLAPLVLGIEDARAAAYFYGQGGGEFLIAGVSDYDDVSGARKPHRLAPAKLRRVA